MSAEEEKLKTFVVVSLYIDSKDMSPNGISEHLGIIPTRTELKDNALLSDQGPSCDLSKNTTNSFILDLRRQFDSEDVLSPIQELEAGIDQMLRQVEPISERLHQLRDHLTLRLMCAFGSHLPPKWIGLSALLLQRIAALNMSLTLYLTRVEGE